MNRRIVTITLTLSPLLASVASACPNCKDSIPNSTAEAAQSLPGGFNYSIYFMLTGLFLVLGLVFNVIRKGIRSTDAAHARRATRV